MSSDCHHMKIIKGKGLIFISISEFVNASAWLVTVCNNLSTGLCSGLGMFWARYAFAENNFINMTLWLV